MSGLNSSIIQGVAAIIPAAEEVNGIMAFSMRSEGESTDNSQNFLTSQNGAKDEVTRYIEKLSTCLQIHTEDIIITNQIHSDHIALLNTLPEKIPSADAIITETPGLFPAIKTADCLPVLVLEPRKGIAAAIHAGWRGTVLRITRKVLIAMKKKFHCDTSDMIVALGPAIGVCCYEVGDQVLAPFRKAIPRADQFIQVKQHVRPSSKASGLSYRLDLTAVNRFELTVQGVPEENIIELGLCTSCNPDMFFSYRRDGARSGRHISLTGFRQ